MKQLQKKDFFSELRHLTIARIGLEWNGVSLSTKHHLQMLEAHARAKDAIFYKMNFDRIEQEMTEALGGKKVYHLQTKVQNRQEYLRNPNLGRELSTASIELLQRPLMERKKINFVIVDGLSPLGVERYALPLIKRTCLYLDQDLIGDFFLIEQGRVGICDALGEILESLMTVVIIGERPGLTTFDSVGAYLTYQARRGKTDAERNCLSNICENGLQIELAAEKLAQLVSASLTLKKSGISLKEDQHFLRS